MVAVLRYETLTQHEWGTYRDVRRLPRFRVVEDEITAESSGSTSGEEEQQLRTVCDSADSFAKFARHEQACTACHGVVVGTQQELTKEVFCLGLAEKACQAEGRYGYSCEDNETQAGHHDPSRPWTPLFVVVQFEKVQHEVQQHRINGINPTCQYHRSMQSVLAIVVEAADAVDKSAVRC